jgi:antitoxin YefM
VLSTQSEYEVRGRAPRRGGEPIGAPELRPTLRDRPEGVAPRRELTIFLVMSDTTLPLAEIKKRLSEIIDGVETRHDRVVLTRNGRPAAVILSPDDLESLEETVAILSDPAAVRAIRKAEVEIDKGKAVSADELRAKYVNR